MLAGPIETAARQLAGRRRGRGRPRAAERPCAWRLRDERGAADCRRLRRAAQGARGRAGERARRSRSSSSGPRSPGRASSTSGSRLPGTDDALAEILGAGNGTEPGPRRRAERVQVELVSANPTGPLTVGSARNGAYGDSVARLLAYAGHDGRAGVLLQRRGQRRSSSSGPRWRRVGAARSRPKDGYQGEYVNELAAVEGDPVEQMLEEIRASARALPHSGRHAGRGRPRSSAKSPESCRARHLRSGRSRLGAHDARTATTRTASLIRSRRRARPTSPPMSLTCATSSSAASTARSTCSAPTTTATSRGLKALAAACWATTRSRIEVLIYQLVHLVEGGEAKKMSKRRGDVVFLDELMDEIGVDAARWYLVTRGHDQPIDIDVDLAASAARRTPSTTCSTRMPGSPGSSATRKAQPSGGEPPIRARAGGARPDQAAGRVPGVVAEAAERRGPHAIPIYAIRRRRRLPPLLPRAPRARRAETQSRSGSAVCRATQR